MASTALSPSYQIYFEQQAFQMQFLIKSSRRLSKLDQLLTQTLDMSQCLVGQSCWCNGLGANLGYNCSLYFCSYQLYQPEAISQMDSDYMRFNPCGTFRDCGFNCGYLGFILYPRYSLRSWSQESAQAPDFKMQSETHQDFSQKSLSDDSPKNQLEWHHDPRIKNCLDQECSVCLGREPTLQLQCGHIFHQECILLWVERKQKCPLCRSESIQKTRTICSGCRQQFYYSELNQKRKQNTSIHKCDKCKDKC